MKALKVLSTVIAVFLAVFIGIGYVLPKEVVVKRSATIDAPPDAVYGHVNAPKKMLEWSPWAKLDPNATWTFEGPDAGVGAKYSWAGNSDVGKGSQEITKVVENREVHTDLHFEGTPPAKAWFKIEPDGDKSQVEWGFRSEMEAPVGTWFGLIMDSFIGPDYETGLANLKRVVEG